MGPLPPLCFRENVIVTCRIFTFLLILLISFWKMRLFSFFGNQSSKWRSFEKKKKRLFLTYIVLFTFFNHQGKDTKIPSAHISLTYKHVFCSPYWPFLPSRFYRNCEFIRYGFSCVWHPGVDSYFVAINMINT